METKCFKYLGLNIKHEGNIMTLDQKNNVDNLIKIDIDIDQRKNITLLLTTSEKKFYNQKLVNFYGCVIKHVLILVFKSVIWHPTLAEPPLMN